jgi:hypothetical protein
VSGGTNGGGVVVGTDAQPIAGTFGAGQGVNAGSATGYNGAFGAVRIIWPGDNRAFPSTNTGDL